MKVLSVAYLSQSSMNHVNILAIGAHPDDIELGCGGLLVKAGKNGHNVYMYTLTRGEASGDPHHRTNELINSAKVIGDLINHIERIILKTGADLVLTHSMHDIHHDHRASATATVEAGRFASNILSYEIPLTKDFKPQV